MSLRREVFQAKVLQKLYPAALKVEKLLDITVHHPTETESFKGVQLKPNKLTGHTVSGRKVYTVLPPPKDYVPASEDGLWLPPNAQPVNNAEEMPADLSGPEEHSGTEDDHISKKRRRRRKRKAALVSEGNTNNAADAAADDAAADDDDKAKDAEERNKGKAEGSECLSRNKRRKLKKKRHKEKLLTLGLMPRTRALEFTYKQSEEDDKEDEEKKVEEVLDFLQSTRELYLSDRSCSKADPSVFLNASESLFTRLSEGRSPPVVLSILCRLRAVLHQREVKHLHTVLQELSDTSTLPKDETDVICSLVHYWITEILPMQMEKTT